MRDRYPFAVRILAAVYRFSLREGLIGDIEEEYSLRYEREGRGRAGFWIWGQALRGLPLLAGLSLVWSLAMLNNYVKIAFRNLIKNRVYTTVNILGLALGIASCILIFLYVRFETGYDNFQERAGRIYRVFTTEDPPDRDPFTYIESPYHLGSALRDSFPEVEETVRLEVVQNLVRVGERSFAQRFHLADPAFFKVFSFPLVRGNSDSALSALDSAVLTESLSAKFFGDGDPMGERITVQLPGGAEYDFVVSGIASDPPANSSIRFEMLIPFENVSRYRSQRQLDHWLNVVYETYVLLKTPLEPEEIDLRLAAVVRNHYPERFAAVVTLHFQPLTGIHLDPEVPAGFEPTGSPRYPRILSGIALLVLIIACFNFLSLAVGGSVTRAREVGVRKMVGALRSQLALQFLGETVFLSLGALLTGLFLARLMLPRFNYIVQRELSLALDLPAVSLLAALTLLTGVLAGGYPALLLSRFQPVRVMDRKPRLSGFNLLILWLVVGQFALSIGFIVCTFVMRDQLRFLLHKDLGFRKEQVIVVENSAFGSESQVFVERFRDELSSQDRILGVSGASSTFGENWTVMGFKGTDGLFRQFNQITVDPDFLDILGICLREGRFFSREFSTDPDEALVVNQAFVDEFQWGSGVGRSIPGPDFPPHRIIGVVDDFFYRDLRSRTEPLVLAWDPTTLFKGIDDINTSHDPRSLGYIHVRFAPGDPAAAVSRLEAAWKKAAPGQPFRFSFVDENLRRQYAEIQRWGTIVGGASIFSVLIACLGLFGLAAMTAARRTKEIGVRKVLGATSGGIVWLLVREFGKPVLTANLAAWPVAFLVMRRWLEDFPFRVAPGPDRFLLAALLVLAVAVTTVGWQSFRAARTDPVCTIRHE